jgi:hypothetical protein
VPLNLSLYPVILYNECYTWFQKSLDFGANLWIRMVRFLDSAPTLPRIRQKLGGKLDLAGFDFFPGPNSTPRRQKNTARIHLIDLHVPPRLKLYGLDLLLPPLQPGSCR